MQKWEKDCGHGGRRQGGRGLFQGPELGGRRSRALEWACQEESERVIQLFLGEIGRDGRAHTLEGTDLCEGRRAKLET
jgi:hypothetical protein